MRPTTAAKNIQRFWRRGHLTTHTIVSNLLSKGHTLDRIIGMGYKNAFQFVRSREAIMTLKAALRRIHTLCVTRHGSSETALSSVNTGYVVSAYLVVAYDSIVIETMDHQATEMRKKAIAFLNRFEMIARFIARRHYFQAVPANLTVDFETLLMDFLTNFHEWKIPDQERILIRIRHAIIALLQTRKTIQNGQEQIMAPEIDAGIENLRLKYKQIAGESALSEFEKTIQSEAKFISAPQIVDQPKIIGIPKIIDNRQLAHELLLDNNFRLDDEMSLFNPTALQVLRKESAQAYWRSLLDELRLAPPLFVSARRVIEHLRIGLQQHTTESVDDVFSQTQRIQEQALNGVLNLDTVKNFITSVFGIIQKIQYPSRDEESLVQWNMFIQTPYTAVDECFCHGIEFLANRLDTIHVDYTNSRLTLMAARVLSHGIDFETTKFKENLDSGALTLERTTAWINQIKGNATIDDAIKRGIEDLVLGNHNISDSTIPETLLLDTHHLIRLNQEFYSMVVASAVYLRLSTMLGHASMCRLGDWLDRNYTLDPENILAQLVDEPIDRAAVTSAILQVSRPEDRVYQTVRRRLQTTWTKLSDEKELDATDAVVATVVKNRMDKAVAQLNRICELNLKVHKTIYEEVWANFMAE